MSEPPLERVGLLGGTFDPPHYGHLVAAQEAAFRLGLQRVLFMPANRNPLKQTAQVSAADDRFAMVEQAVQGNPLFEASRLDLDRPAPSYTADLLRLLHAERPNVDWYFIAGADVLAELHAWHQPDEVLRLATFVAITRRGWPEPDLAALQERFPASAHRVVTLAIPGVDISSSAVRRRVQTGEPIRYLVPAGVERHIRERGLYLQRPENDEAPSVRR